MAKSKPKPLTSATSTPEMLVAAPILAVDLGGSKCEMARYQPDGGAFFGFARYASRDFTGIGAMLRRYQAESGPLPKRLALAIAGVVDGDNAQMTNLDWRIEGEELRRAFDLDSVLLLNDLTAVCAALPFLAGGDLLVLQEGEVHAEAPAAVLAPGTGLGEGMLLMGGNPGGDPGGSCRHALGGEGGHCDFAPTSDEQIELLRFMRRRHETVSYEMVAAGVSMINLLQFYEEVGGLTAKPDVATRLAAAADKTPIIVEAALATDFCPLCRKTLTLFLEILGAEAGNLALKVYARRGLYLAGGILPRLIGKISFAPFLAAFGNKKTMATLLATIPIFLVRHPHPALLGAAQLARRLAEAGKTWMT